ncbi:MAG: DUF835 domain-containing protein [Euryarchaeota archaeon]|nr:DUF835 domain-containing protein [Euryarchaeota archaeon]
MLSILETKYKDDSHRVIRRLNAYKKIFTYVNDLNFFNSTAGPIYSGIKSGIRVKDLPVAQVEQKLRARLRDDFLNITAEMRASGYGREADKIEEFVERGEFKNAYLTLKEVREREKRNEKIDEITLRINDILTRLEVLREVNSDISDLVWSIAELLGVNRIKLTDKKMVFINDPAGNIGCLLSLYLRRLGHEFTFFGTKNNGDFWITALTTPNSINPTLRTSELSEKAVQESGIIIVEDINYLILHNKFSEVYTFLQYLKNQAKARIIVTGSFKLLNEREITRLRGLFDSAITISTLFNPCTSKMIGVRSRLNSGSLLLSKELVEDFEGKTVMIADFGGEKYIHPQRIDFEIADLIHEHIKKGDVIIDCLDLLIDENGLEKIYVWLKKIRDATLQSPHRVYVVMNDLISREKEFLLPLMDIDAFHIADTDPRVIEVVEKKMELLSRRIDRQIEKECAYNMEIIRQKYAKYSKYLTSIKDEVEEVLNAPSQFGPEFLRKTTPLREHIEKLVESIEAKSEKFEKEYEEIVNAIQTAKIYVDVEEVEYCIQTAKNAYDSGDIDRAIDKIALCASKAEQMMESAMQRAEELREEISCVKDLLPEYFQTKLEKYEGGIENLQEFTHLFKDVLRLLRERVDEEYARLKKYSIVSGIEFPTMDSQIRNLELCKYAKEREKFMEKFNAKKDTVMENLKGISLKIMKFLTENGYQLPISKRAIERGKDFDEMFSMVERINNHLAMFISKNLDDLKNRYPEYTKEHERDIERILVELSLNPLNAIMRYTTFVTKLNREMGVKEAKLAEIRKTLRNYYSMLKKYNLPIEEWYPKNIEDGEKIVEFLGRVFGALNPEISVDIPEVAIDEERNASLKIIVENTGNFMAKDVSMEIYGAVKISEKIGSMKNGEKKELTLEAKVIDPDEPLNVDVFYENVDGKIITKSFVFEANIKGYAVTKATGAERCVLCRGKIFKGTELVICSECGATYHRTCAERLSKCKICGNTFFF